jgi:hypothetical protein
MIFFCASAAGAAGEDYGEGGVLACGAAAALGGSEVEVQWGMFGMVTEPKKA